MSTLTGEQIAALGLDGWTLLREHRHPAALDRAVPGRGGGNTGSGGGRRG